MSWAGQRRAIILTLIGGVILVVLVSTLIATFYQAPTCTDHKQNQDEVGVDCGGSSCTYLCESQTTAPIVRFTKALTPAPGRTAVIAYVDNPNSGAAAAAAPYSLSVYGSDHTLITTEKGTVDLPPGKSVPIFFPSLASGKTVAAQAFLTFDNSIIRWYAARDMRVVPSVANPVLGGTAGNPRVTAAITNPIAQPLRNVKVVATVFDGGGNVVGASQTILTQIPAQGSVTATFTWNAAFLSPPARIEVVPVIPLVSR